MEEAAGIGHNLSPEALEAYLKRIEQLIEDRKAVNADIRQVFEEAEMSGFDKKCMKDVLKIRNTDPDERAAFIETRDAYLSALGLLG